jgi:aspartate/methionine/tyrosine aminotransferase
MKYNTFTLEEYMAKYEFQAPYLFCCSDAETVSMKALLDGASPEDKLLWDNLSLGYTETRGLPLLRQQICDSLYPSLNQDNILCFVGAEEGIFCALNVLCTPADHVIVLSPCYQSLLEIPKQCTPHVTEIELRYENSWKIDFAAIENALQPNTKLIVVNFPHNPTGQIITVQELNDLIALCEKRDLWLFSDEVYRLLGNPTRDASGWPQPAACLYPKAVSLGVMSKSFGLAGLRIGWIACQQASLLHAMEGMKHYTSICNSAPAELLAYFALKQKDQLLERNNSIVQENLDLLNNFVKKYSALFEWVVPEGGCVGFMKYKGHKKTLTEFCDGIREKKGILFLPATEFNKPGLSFFRIGFGRANMKDCLQRLIEYVEENDL